MYVTSLIFKVRYVCVYIFLSMYSHITFHQNTQHANQVAVMAFRVIHGLACTTLSEPAIVRVSDLLPGRHRLHSSSSQQLLVPPFQLTTVGRRSFPVAASLLWNSLPSDIQSSPSLPVFRLSSKTFLFRQSFPDFVLWLYYASVDFVIVLPFQPH